MAECFSEGDVRIQKGADTFFNPAQKFNRDVSIAAIKSYFRDRKRVRILAAMEATGMRGIRYLKEIDNIEMYFNDLCPLATKTIASNLDLNGLSDYRVLSENESLRDHNAQIIITTRNCMLLMNQYHGFFDVIDIDPFGSCSMFIDDAIRAVKNNGLLCFTCTDKAALCAREEKCFVRYGSLIKRIYAKNETPVRVLLSTVSRAAARHEASIEPVICISVDFYVRIIVKVLKKQEKAVLRNNAHALICECHNWRKWPFNSAASSACDVCGATMKLYGPFWSAPLYDFNIVNDILSSMPIEGNERITGVLRLMRQELDAMFYYELPKLCSKLKISSCKLKALLTSLANYGYDVSLVYYDTNAFKTSAPLEKINQLLKGELEMLPTPNEKVEKIYAEEYFKGAIMSGLKPGSLPEK